MLDDIVKDYLEIFPAEMARLQKLMTQLKKHEDLQTRRNPVGHITGGAIVLSPDRTAALMIHHRVLGRWLQPGGHWDPEDTTPLIAAQREAEEETAVRISAYLPICEAKPLVPINLDSHLIPANHAKGEGEHYHHDFKYVFIAGGRELIPQADEVHEAAWVDLGDPRLELALGPALAKLRQFKII